MNFEERVNVRYNFMTGLFETLRHRIFVDCTDHRYWLATGTMYNIDRILKDIYDTFLKCEEYYVREILMRSFSEHFIVAAYLGSKSCKEGIDAGHNYVYNYGKSEQVKQWFYDISVKTRVTKENTKAPLEVVNESYGVQLKQVDIDNIHSKSRPFFDVRDMVSYLYNLPESEFFSGFSKTLTMNLNVYNYSSTFVHGGPSAIQQVARLPEEDKAQRQIFLKSFAEISIAGLKELIIYILTFKDKQYDKVGTAITNHFNSYFPSVRKVRVYKFKHEKYKVYLSPYSFQGVHGHKFAKAHFLKYN